MKKSIFKKLGGLFLGLAMGLGVAVGVTAGNKASEVKAEDALIKTVDFESGFTTSTTYNNSNEKSDGPTNEKWKYVCGTAITGKAFALRYYKSVGSTPYLMQDYDVSNVSYVKFDAKTESTNNKLDVFYSTNSGSTWTNALSGQALTSTSTTYTILGDNTTTFSTFRLKFAYNNLSTEKKSIIIDNIKFYQAEAPDAELTAVTLASEGSVKKAYEVGESFDSTGLTVYASWDGVQDTTKNIADKIIWSPEELTKSTTQVTGYYVLDAEQKFSITVSGISVTEADYIITSSNWGISSTTKPTSSNPVTNDVNGIDIVVNYGYVYSGNMSMNPSYSGYIGNSEAYPKYLDKVVITYADTNSAGRANFYPDSTGIGNGSSSAISGNASETVVTYNLSSYKTQFWSLRQKTTGSSNYINIKKIAVYLGASLDINAESIEITSSDFTIENKTITLEMGTGEGIVDGTLNAAVLPSNTTNKDVTWDSSDNLNAQIDSGYLIINTEIAGKYTVTAYADGAAEVLSVYDTITIEVIDTSQPVLLSVTVGGTPVSPQFTGKDFNYSGLTFTPVYDKTVEAGSEDVIDPSTLSWSALTKGENQTITASYSSEKFSGTVLISVSGINVIDDYVTDIQITGNLTKTAYYTTEQWSSDGLTVKGHYASDPNTLETISDGISFEYEPSTPESADVTSVDVTASLGEISSTAKSFNVTVTVKQNLGSLKNGHKYFILSSENAILTAKAVNTEHSDYVEDYKFNQGKNKPFTSTATVVTNGSDKEVTAIDGVDEADLSEYAFTFNEVGDDKWTISNGTYSLTNGNTNNGLALNQESGYTFDVSESTTSGYFHLKSETNPRYICYYSGGPDWRTYNNLDNGDPNIYFVEYVAPATYDSLTVSATATGGWTVGQSPTLSDLGATVKAVYSSGDKKTVTSDATITAGLPLEKGNNTLTISYTDTKLNVNHTTTLAVNDVVQPVTGLSMNTYNSQMVFEGTQELSVAVTPNDANNKVISWESSNTSIATVTVNAQDSTKATVTALKAVGEVTITAKTTDGSNKSVTAKIQVNDPTVHVTGITISGSATKTSYYAGNAFDTSGLTVTAAGTDANVTNDVTWTPNPLTAGTTSVTATYTCDDGTFTDTLNGITVYAREIQSIEIVSEPSKLQYRQGESLDTTGLSVTAHYQLDDEENITGYTLTGYDMNVRGEQTVTVSYLGKTDTFDIYVTIPEMKMSYETAGTAGYYEVTSIDELKANDIVTFVASKSDGSIVVPSSWTYNSKNALYYLEAGAASLSETGELTASTMVTFTLGVDDSHWTFTSDDELLGTNAAKALQKGSGDTSWDIVITDGVTTVSSTTAGYGAIKYNPSSPRFLNYASGQTDIKLYKYQTPTTTSEFTISETLYDAVVKAKSCFTCDYNNGLSFASGKSWDDVKAAFASVSEEEMNKFKAGIGVPEYENGERTNLGNEVENFLSVYDYLVTYKGYENFLSRNISSASPRINPILALSNVDNSVWVISAVALVGLTAIGGYFFYRKRKEI